MALHKKLVKFLSQIEKNCSKHSLNSGEILVLTYDVYNNYVYTLSSCDIQFFDVFYKF